MAILYSPVLLYFQSESLIMDGTDPQGSGGTAMRGSIQRMNRCGTQSMI